LGRGEILIGGNVLTDGYYRKPKETAASYMPGGFFATGDIGEWTPDGSLKIVDRKKNLVKLKGGEYVALELMETKFNNSDFVDALGGGIMVYAGGDVDRPVAFVQCNRKTLTDWAAANGVSGEFEQLIKEPKVWFGPLCSYLIPEGSALIHGRSCIIWDTPVVNLRVCSCVRSAARSFLMTLTGTARRRASVNSRSS
jgi:acyl-CoA synthetase (AMP-forming)/AMP-acid ligase II